MGNLGWYQILTTFAKKVGGPKNLIGLLLGFGAFIGGGVVHVCTKLKKKIDTKHKKKKQLADAAIVYTVNKGGFSNEGLRFNEKDEFKVLETDGNVGLIEIIGDKNSPYYVSLKFLSSISNYKLK
ncbi:MAG: hypothetical protein J6B75_08410 [Ruminococcus sp.]|nr:hypothetical protein [Ruminococcus sp.]